MGNSTQGWGQPLKAANKPELGCRVNSLGEGGWKCGKGQEDVKPLQFMAFCSISFVPPEQQQQQHRAALAVAVYI